MKKIYEDAEKEMNAGNKGTHKTLIKLSDYYDAQRMKTLAQIIHLKDTDDSRINITFDKESLQVNEYNKNE